jgi:hypothetical protein
MEADPSHPGLFTSEVKTGKEMAPCLGGGACGRQDAKETFWANVGYRPPHGSHIEGSHIEQFR